MALFSKKHWSRYTGKNDWRIPDQPGSGLVHLPCGRSEIKVEHKTVNLMLPRSAGLGPMANDEQASVGFLYCTKCHAGETYPDMMMNDEVIEKG